jgi:hypothetical protein
MGLTRKYEWNPKWNKDKNYNCETCKWLGVHPMIGSGGEHWSCSFNETWQRWVPQKLAKRKAVCTVPEERRKFRDSNVHWDPVEGFKPKPVTPLHPAETQATLLHINPGSVED